MYTNMAFLSIFIAIMLSSISSSSAFSIEEGNEFAQSVLKAGEEHYKLATTYSQMPVYGKCWTKPLESLPVACGNLMEDVHKWLALTFANCFLIQSHQKPHPCVESTPSNISECLEMGMDDRVFSTYNTFYVHTHNMCYFLKSQLWQEETKKTVFRLMDASQRVVTSMESQLEIQQKISRTQEEALQNGNELRKEMDITIAKSKENLQELLEEIRQSSGQQVAIFDEIAHHIVKLRALFFGEFVGVYTALYYFFIVIISYLLTSCKRLEGARLWLYLAFTVSFALEYTVGNWNTEESIRLFSDEAQNMIYARVWFIRKTAISMGFVIVSICGWRYRDYIDIVYELQKDNLQTRKEILSLIKAIGQPASPTNISAEQPNSDNSTSSTDELEVTQFDKSVTQSTPIKLRSSVKETLDRSNSFVDDIISPSEQMRRPSPYNLRERSRSPQTFSPVKESTKTFAKLVYDSAEISKRNSTLARKQIRAIKKTVKGTSLTCLSSDED
ncbi:hypothetical protein CHUAL_005190 [Chamberlinius hualienensis]